LEEELGSDSSNVKALMAYDIIRNLILSGAKLPGTRLVLSELEEELQIGRGPIREALMRLDRSGLVKNIPYKGAIVASPPKLKEMRYLYEIRVNIELKLALEAMDNLTEEDFKDLENLYEQMKKLPESGGNFFTLDRRFHRRLYEASQLPHLCLIVHKLLESVEVFLNLYSYEPQDCSLFIEEHALILKSLREKNANVLSETLEKNILGGLNLIDKQYQKIVKCS
jgi:DNA-binding GntR family transcriptional regulator